MDPNCVASHSSTPAQIGTLLMWTVVHMVLVLIEYSLLRENRIERMVTTLASHPSALLLVELSLSFGFSRVAMKAQPHAIVSLVFQEYYQELCQAWTDL
jgi:hypothetical protein